ncbi:MAG: glutathione S-transferase family protein [Alphaproteobacteria bacterium]|nr:glutathione S-transferase family protein [Alphaproteobacteria bacterium]
MAAEPILYGASYSVYVRAVRLALAEKGVRYRLEPVDVFAPAGPPEDHLARHPFGKIPAFEHGPVRLYEAVAIERYVDEAFDGPPLQPADAAGRARMTQIQSILDSYAYRSWVWDLYVERCEGDPPDEARIAAARPIAGTALDAIERIAEDGPFFFGAAPTLADLHAAPMLALLSETPEGRALLEDWPFWQGWWTALSERPSFAQSAGG